MFLGFQADLELVSTLDKARGRKDRSLFIREAIAEKLARAGIRVREELIYPPQRAASVVQINGSSDQRNQIVVKKVSYSKKPAKKRKKK